LGIITVDFGAAVQLLVIYLHSSNIGGKNGNTLKQCVGFKKAFVSVRREVLYNTLSLVFP